MHVNDKTRKGKPYESIVGSRSCGRRIGFDQPVYRRQRRIATHPVERRAQRAVGGDAVDWVGWVGGCW